MKRPDLDAIEARAKAASDEAPGAWTINKDENAWCWEVVRPSDVTTSGTEFVAESFDEAVAEFVVAAHAGIPAFVAYCRELEVRLAAAHAAAGDDLRKRFAEIMREDET